MNVTPLVDVVLVLLIIFMIVIPAMAEGIDIEPPSIVNVDEKHDDLEPFLLSATANGALYFDEVLMDPSELESFLREANKRQPQRRLVLRGDRDAHYGRVRELLAIVQKIGFPGISLRVGHRKEGS